MQEYDDPQKYYDSLQNLTARSSLKGSFNLWYGCIYDFDTDGKNWQFLNFNSKSSITKTDIATCIVKSSFGFKFIDVLEDKDIAVAGISIIKFLCRGNVPNISFVRTNFKKVFNSFRINLERVDIKQINICKGKFGYEYDVLLIFLPSFDNPPYEIFKNSRAQYKQLGHIALDHIRWANKAIKRGLQDDNFFFGDDGWVVVSDTRNA